jgi:hypothetical protein
MGGDKDFTFSLFDEGEELLAELDKVLVFSHN